MLDPEYGALQSEGPKSPSELGGRRPPRAEPAARIQHETIGRARSIEHQPGRHQVVGLALEQSAEGLTSVHRWTHPFSVNRLSSKTPLDCTGVISCMYSLGKNAQALAMGRMTFTRVQGLCAPLAARPS